MKRRTFVPTDTQHAQLRRVWKKISDKRLPYSDPDRTFTVMLGKFQKRYDQCRGLKKEHRRNLYRSLLKHLSDALEKMAVFPLLQNNFFLKKQYQILIKSVTTALSDCDYQQAA